MKAIALASSLLFVMPQSFLAPRPPAEFVGNSAEPIVVYYAEPLIVDAVCRRLLAEGNPPDQQIPDDWVVYACTNSEARRTILPDPCLPIYAGETFASVACHEKGHANSWGWEY